MTETTETVFRQYQVRKTKKQKTAFIEYVREQAQKGGYDCHVERGSFGARNIVVGDPKTAKVVYTAHYDTCARLPFPNFITPKNFLIYLLYQIAVVILFFFVPLFLVGVAIGALETLAGIEEETLLTFAPLVSEGLMILLLILLVAGPANKHTANDNTSGVTVLLDLMRELPPEHRHHAAFIFFDLEEMGLFGSSGYASKHKKEMTNTLLVNFDCISDGDHIIFALRKGARNYASEIETAFAPDGDLHTEVLTKGVFYPSDQVAFPCGVGVAALKREKRTGILYMNRIHTNRDVIYREQNAQFLTNGAIKLTALLAAPSEQ